MVVAGVLCAGYFMVAGFDKAWWSGVQGWGRPYWWLDYGHGFVRRGLAGQIFQAVLGRLPEDRLGGPVSVIHDTCSAVLAVATLYWFARALWITDGGQRAVAFSIGLWAAAGQFWPTLAYNQGYLDSLTLAWAVCAAMAFRARQIWMAGALMATGPFIHEYFAFLVPFILASGRMQWIEQSDARSNADLLPLDETVEQTLPLAALALAGVSFASCALVTVAASASAARAEIAAMPLSDADKTMLATTTLTQTIGKSLNDDLALLLQNPAFTFRNFVFFLAPTVVAVIGILFWGGAPRERGRWLRAAAAVFPVAALLLAWDLSRLLVMSNLTAGLLFLMTVSEGRTAPQRSGRTPWVAVVAACGLSAAALAYTMAPLAYVYYEPGPATLFPLKLWPGDGRSTYGYERLWKNAHNTALPDPPLPIPSASPTGVGITR